MSGYWDTAIKETLNNLNEMFRVAMEMEGRRIRRELAVMVINKINYEMAKKDAETVDGPTLISGIREYLDAPDNGKAIIKLGGLD